MEIYRVAYDHALHRLKHAITAEQIMTRQVITVAETAMSGIPLAPFVSILVYLRLSPRPWEW